MVSLSPHLVSHVAQTAGRGVRHQEHNLHETLPLRFIQIWMTPRMRGLPPNYGSGQGSAEKRLNQWSVLLPLTLRLIVARAHMVSDVTGSLDTPVKINQDANIFVTEVTSGGSSSLTIGAGRQAYFLLVEGHGLVTTTNQNLKEESELDQHDGAEIFGPCTLTLTPSSSSSSASVHALVVEMAETGPGREDL
jgi:quercetin 2,3-dioxygenase